MKLYQLLLTFFPLSISGDIRPIYSECNTCLARQRNGENIACPIECETYGIGPAIPPPPPCPPCPPSGTYGPPRGSASPPRPDAPCRLASGPSR